MKKILYFFDDSLVGYLKNGKWYGPKDVKLKELFDNGNYTIYTTEHKKLSADRVRLRVGSIYGYGSFSYEDGDANHTSEDNIELLKYALSGSEREGEGGSSCRPTH